MEPTRVAMIGTGTISRIYLENITNVFKNVKLIGVCDLVRERAESAQQKYGVPMLYETMYDAFEDPDVEIILNLTRPHEHFDVTMAALEAGKHVYTEKPLAASIDEGRILVSLASERGLKLCGAPDTFLGAGIQTCRDLIDSGAIGTPVGAQAHMISRGPESWHPDPAFLYKYGAGPMLDMGPYYVTALTNLLGRVSGVTGMVKRSFEKRLITSKPLDGTVIDVSVPTYVQGVMEFESGAIASLFTTFDAYYTGSSRLEVFGSEGTLRVPDPNTFSGPVYLLRPGSDEWEEIPVGFDYKVNSRGLGLSDMAKAINSGREPRAGASQIFHVLEVMESFAVACKEKEFVTINSAYERRAPMPGLNSREALNL